MEIYAEKKVIEKTFKMSMEHKLMKTQIEVLDKRINEYDKKL